MILCVGRIHPRKGQLELLEAIEQLPAELKSGLTCHFVGPFTHWNYYEKVKECARLIGCEVQFHGDQQDSELLKFYHSTDIFALTPILQPKSVEGFGFVYLEASFHGLPIIGHKVGGVEDAVKNGETGLLVDPSNRQGLSSALQRLIEDKDLVDFVILGEGELPFLELCQKLLQENMVLQTNIGSDIANLAFLDEDGKCVMGTEKLARNTKLNSDIIPFPARHLLPMENYILAQESHGFSNGRWTSMISSRGCPYGCTFCASRKTRWVSRSATDVADEIEYCIENWDIREFHFEDDNMTINVKRLIEICNEIKRRKLDIRWQTPNGIRASRIDEEMLTAMKDSGCEHVTLAPESGSPRVLTDIVQKGKDFDLQHLKDCGATAHKIGLKVAAYFVLGLPGETREDMEMTIAYARELAKVGVDEVNFGLFIPLPGTPLWEPSKHKIKDLDWLDLLTVGDLAKAVSFNDEVGSKELDWVRKKAYMSFLLTRIIYHPTQFAGTIFNVFRGIEKTKSERVLRNLVRRYKKDAKDGINKLVFDNRTFYAYRHMYRKIFRLIFR